MKEPAEGEIEEEEAKVSWLDEEENNKSQEKINTYSSVKHLVISQKSLLMMVLTQDGVRFYSLPSFDFDEEGSNEGKSFPFEASEIELITTYYKTYILCVGLKKETHHEIKIGRYLKKSHENYFSMAQNEPIYHVSLEMNCMVLGGAKEVSIFQGETFKSLKITKSLPASIESPEQCYLSTNDLGEFLLFFRDSDKNKVEYHRNFEKESITFGGDEEVQLVAFRDPYLVTANRRGCFFNVFSLITKSLHGVYLRSKYKNEAKILQIEFSRDLKWMIALSQRTNSVSKTLHFFDLKAPAIPSGFMSSFLDKRLESKHKLKFENDIKLFSPGESSNSIISTSSGGSDKCLNTLLGIDFEGSYQTIDLEKLDKYQKDQEPEKNHWWLHDEDDFFIV